MGIKPSNKPAVTQDEVKILRLYSARAASWFFGGMLAVDKFVHVLELQHEPEDSRDYATLGGFVISRMERIPQPGDHFE
ncbi:transporter associated domain-containing protein [Armatimonas sp.]|uniref:transporter associated domain-containing protein n=1 Tax=Armatimonas sp. TaxID=1872638 RepID=UPI0037531AB0